MPTYKVQCDTCNAEYEDAYFRIDQYIDKCPACECDMCEKCKDTDWHEHKDQEEENEAGE